MIKQLKEHYPNAIIQPIPLQDPNFFCFFIEEENLYIGIPSTDLTQPEIELLKSLFPALIDSKNLNKNKKAQDWYKFLIGSDTRFQIKNDHQEYRIIQFSISQYKDQFELKHLEEAMDNIFSHPVINIFTTQSEGMIVEAKHPFSLTEQELLSTIQAFESDFYFKIHFFVGQYRTVDQSLRSLFQLEELLFRFALKDVPKERVLSLANVFPLYLLKSEDFLSRQLLFSQIFEAFNEDKDLWKTIKLYLENNLNTSQTAKQLFMHRNSLQYRVDKFIEKTGSDLKTFSGAITVYLACMDYETHFENNKNVPKF